ncbi:MAG: hypothetical protein C0611_05975 [Desulfobacteraceae bacterium]|nr:MAG: hypothetical protein C0611_05975 [Desulfobacteraceae bacterium]
MVKFVLRIKLEMINILLKTNLPVFHHSIIPYPRQALKPQKMSYIFIKLSKFRDVKVEAWKKSRNSVKHIYELTSKLPDAEKFA